LSAFLQLTLQISTKMTALANPAVRRVLVKQIYFTGFEAAPVIIFIALTIGTIIIAQSLLLFGSGNASLTARALIWIVVREIGPLLTALIVIARSGAAIATELGTMKINGEIDTLAGLGISPLSYLLLPRISGGILSVVALTVYFEVTAILGGFLVASLGWHLPAEQFFQGLYQAINLQQIFVSGLKSAIFGLIITVTACLQGMGIGRSATMIPQAATRAVMNSLLLVFMVDGLFAILAEIFATR
jgi:phospholipid/cholesterol/gamma-HCH transport system permease protein